MTAEPTLWSVLVPVKRIHEAKSRFAGLSPDLRREFVTAMAADVVQACLASERVDRVFVVTANRELGRELARPRGAHWIADSEGSLNASLRAALAAVPAPGSIAVVPGDLPALDPVQVTRALALAAAHATAFVPDASGTGTTVYASVDSRDFDPGYGPRSREAHAARGCREIDFPAACGIRCDVDDRAGLEVAVALGVGQHTGALHQTIRSVA